MSKILGIDYGGRKVGLAMADGRVAVPWKILESKNCLDEISVIVSNEKIEKVVVGWPLNMSGEKTAQTEVVERFISDLKNRISVEVISRDERLTSVQAQKQGVKGDDDAVAAMHILQSYLDKIYG